MQQPGSGASGSSIAKRWDSVGGKMRSDERFFFYLAAAVFTFSVVYTIFFQVIPFLEDRHEYTYAHCTATGAGHWEKYGTVNGIEERVVVPVEPQGWKYFTAQDKVDYLDRYKPGHEYECWARSSTQFHEVVFHRQIIFLVIMVGLCMATGVCLVRCSPDKFPTLLLIWMVQGMMDMGRALIGLSEMNEEESLQEVLIGNNALHPGYGAAIRQKGSDQDYQ